MNKLPKNPAKPTKIKVSLMTEDRLTETIRVRIPAKLKRQLNNLPISPILRPVIINPVLFQTLTDQAINIPETINRLFIAFFHELSAQTQAGKRLPKKLTIKFDLVPNSPSKNCSHKPL